MEITWLNERMMKENMLFGLIHCDMHRLNMLIENEATIKLFDFEYTGTNPIAYEFANSFFVIL